MKTIPIKCILCANAKQKGTITIMEALKQNTALKHLYLGTNGITSASCPAIRDYLKNHNRLQSLYLSLNRIGDEGAKILAGLCFCSSYL